MQKQLRFLGILLISIFLAHPSQAQNVTGATISGVVMDSKGGPASGATIIAMHTPSGTQYGTACDADGHFTIPAVRVGGPYTITATVMGNKKELNDIYLSLGQNYFARIQLSESNVELKSVAIIANKSNVMNNKRTGAGTTITNEMITNMPIITRSLSDITKLTPQSNGNNFAGRNNLYNNITLDGSLFNNSFGLASQVGGQTNSQPFSLDAIDQVQVNIAPYDVRQSNFTGANVNAITKSGDNTFRASVYTYFRNQSLIGTKVDTSTITNTDLKQIQSGAWISGPIIKNKLFFFANYELERRTDPGSTYNASTGSNSGSNVSSAKASDLDALSDFLKSKYGYDAGPYQGYNYNTKSDKAAIKFDYNINNTNKLTLRYNLFYSQRQIPPSNSGALRQPSISTMPFEGVSYIQHNNLNSVVAELNSRFSNKIANNLLIGYDALRDYRSLAGSPFPTVDIANGSGVNYTSFGAEPFTPNNKLSSDIYQFTDNVSIYLPKNAITAGIDAQYNSFENGFTPNYYGNFQYASLTDFYNSTPIGTVTPIGASTGAGHPTNYNLQYSIVAGDKAPLAKLKVGQVGIYVQDEIQALKNLKVTVGLRVDMPFYPITLQKNDSVSKLSFGDGEKIDVSKYPNANPLYSPRLGFNWDAMNDNTLQVRGGTGIFTGHIPFVWLSNQASNNGVLFGNISDFNSKGLTKYSFTSDPNAYVPTSLSGNSTVLINTTNPNFKFPQVWRSSLGIDKQLPFGLIAGLDGLYSQDVNAVYHKDINLKPASGTLTTYGGNNDNRNYYYVTSSKNRINPYVTNAIELENVSKGYSYFATINIQKEFSHGWYAMIAYTYGQSKDYTSNPGSTAKSAWTGNPVQSDPNSPVLSYSDYDQPHRFLASASYKIPYKAKNFSTIVSVFYNLARQGTTSPGAAQIVSPSARFSYTYAGDLNGDGITGNDLIYIPRNVGEINLIDIKDGTGKVLVTAAQQWSNLDAYISQDKYLNNHRGEIMQRNGELFPWRGQLDVKLTQDISFMTGSQKGKIQLTLDILNIGNLLNPKWGLLQTPARANLITFKGIDPTTKLPTFQYPSLNGQALTSTYLHDNGITSRWLMQIGIRYNFN